MAVDQTEESLRLRRELAQLRKEQMEALQKARFIPMSDADAEKHEERRKKIVALLRRLDGLAHEDKKK